MLIDIIEPFERMENSAKKIEKLITALGDLLINKINSTKMKGGKRGDYISMSNEKHPSDEVKPVSIGYSGFGIKRGRIATISKVVKQYDFAVGLISKKIPMGFNYNNKTLGISTAYYCFRGSIPIANFYFFKTLQNHWEHYVKHSSRQGQGFDKDLFLNEKMDIPTKETFKEFIDVFNLILSLRHNFEKIKYTEIKEKVIELFFR